MRTMWRRALKRKREEAVSRAGVRQGPDGGVHTHGVDPGAERELIAHERPQDVPDPRTKGSGHGQKTADKWNQ